MAPAVVTGTAPPCQLGLGFARVKPLRTLTLLLLGLGLFTPSCASKEALGVGSVSILGGVINDPRNKSLRFDVLRFGLERFCFEMTRRGVPLKLADDQPVIGRFFAASCSSQVLDDDARQSFVVQFAGKGYGWTQPTGRVGFEASGLMEYAPDFQLEDGVMYVYFRPKQVDAVKFSLTQDAQGQPMVENALTRGGMALLGIDANELGRKIALGQLRRGFTVLRLGSSGEVEFGMGLIPPGQRPFRPFQVKNATKLALVNERTEVHRQQQDLVGAFEVSEDDQALFVDATLDGAEAVDVLVVPKHAGDAILEHLTHAPGPAQLPSQPLLSDVLGAAQPYRRYLPLPKGLYYLVFDNSAGVGQVSPPQIAGDDRAAKIDYLVQLGDRL